MFPPFSFYVCTYLLAYLDEYFLLDQGLERLFYHRTVALGETPSVPERRVGRGVRDCGVRVDPRAAPCARCGWTCHRSGIAWFRSVVWVDGRASQAQRLPKSPVLAKHVSLLFFFLPLMFVQCVGFFSSNDVT